MRFTDIIRGIIIESVKRCSPVYHITRVHNDDYFTMDNLFIRLFSLTVFRSNPSVDKVYSFGKYIAQMHRRRDENTTRNAYLKNTIVGVPKWITMITAIFFRITEQVSLHGHRLLHVMSSCRTYIFYLFVFNLFFVFYT